ncbi:unnamed protein product [Phytophthora lilii]|uniref:Unnamed protein product n=1 Tax=Phytophthora lilii TaxID=2077276 RepID=A0A9W6U965_9STRA|nr:unnamed protein product [Phytophthora lilii]
MQGQPGSLPPEEARVSDSPQRGGPATAPGARHPDAKTSRPRVANEEYPEPVGGRSESGRVCGDLLPLSLECGECRETKVSVRDTECPGILAQGVHAGCGHRRPSRTRPITGAVAALRVVFWRPEFAVAAGEDGVSWSDDCHCGAQINGDGSHDEARASAPTEYKSSRKGYPYDG